MSTLKGDIGRAFNAFIKKTFLRENGTVSTAKVGMAIAATGGAILGAPASVVAIGAACGVTLVVVLPVAVATGAKIAVGIGTYIAGLGIRDAQDKKAESK